MVNKDQTINICISLYWYSNEYLYLTFVQWIVMSLTLYFGNYLEMETQDLLANWVIDLRTQFKIKDSSKECSNQNIFKTIVHLYLYKIHNSFKFDYWNAMLNTLTRTLNYYLSDWKCFKPISNQDTRFTVCDAHIRVQ